ncbi:RHS repeat-associated core domain-containing protein [Actinoplanes sp. NPDC026623]|uniref:RHS repeat-associated core domain-containing protein n=1 Tax=Actinoplanes sp. NPDC026623 TaxID=3155610 RepID=UPI0033D28C8B
MLVTIASLAVAPTDPAAATPQPIRPRDIKSIHGQKVVSPGRPADLSQGAARKRAPAPVWPAAERATAHLAGAGKPIRAGHTPVRLRAIGASAQAAKVSLDVELLDRAKVPAAERDRLLVRVTRADTGSKAVKTGVSIDYSAFAGAYGGDWASRLRLVTLPECALTTPDAPGCQGVPLVSRNDQASRQVTAEISVPAASEKAASEKTASAKAAPATMLMALAAGAGGNSGDYSATPLQASSTWSAGGNSGDFSWAYPMRSPPSLGGPAPQVSLAYSSASVDGRGETTNNQPSWVGEGFEYWPGFIERRYASCSDDRSNSGANNTADSGDLCWGTDNATLSLSGSGGEMIKDGGGWRLKNDDNSKIEHLTTTVNGDNDNEYWRVTTGEGNQFYFGLNRLPGYTGTAPANKTTNSTWTVPVAGNHANEQCHATAFVDSFCNQAWRWNLDYVVDRHGNTMSLFYKTESNNYGRNNKKTDVVSYTRGGTLDHIDYGTDNRTGKDTTNTATAAPMTVVFTPADRCLSDCGTHDQAHWGDVPWDQSCTSSTTCTDDQGSPTFWSTKRLAQITTKVWNAGAGEYRDVENWTLTHTWPDPGDGTRAGMWLEAISHSGRNAGTVAMPDVNFDWVQLANRVDTATDGKPAMNWMRISTIWTDSGLKLDVRYTDPECSGSNLPSSPQNNTKRCYPVKEQQPNKSIKTEYFHRYLVSTVTQADCVTATGPNCANAVGAPDVTTNYEYVGTPAWHHTDDDGITKDNLRTWSDFRGYRQVNTRVGEPGQGKQTLSEAVYFRGIYGDQDGSGDTRTDKLPAIDGNADGDADDAADSPAVNDEDAFAGTLRQTTVFNGVESTPVSSEFSTPWQSAPTATRKIGDSTTYARHLSTWSTWNATVLAAGGRKVARADYTYDSYGMETQLADSGDVAVTGDEQCTKTTYGRNTTANILALANRIESYALACGKNPTKEEDVISDVRSSFDSRDYGQAPTKGDTTLNERAKSWTPTAGSSWMTTNTYAYDSYGRKTDEGDQRGSHTLTAYTPVSGGPVTKITETNALLWTSTSELEPGYGKAIAKTDVNGRRTDISYDGLGRIIKLWLPNHPKATYSTQPNTEYVYLNKASGGMNAVTTKKLNANGTYVTSHALYDGLLRPRQTQQMSMATGNVGTVFTETKYDAAGRSALTSTHFDAAVQPSTTLFTVLDWQPKVQTANEYDRAGRQTAAVVKSSGAEKWRTTTVYGGDRTSVVPPPGGVATTSITDGQGRTVEMRQYHNAGDVGSNVRSTYDVQTFHYDARGNKDSVTDNAGSSWTYQYDLMGRQTGTTDPDKGSSSVHFDNNGDMDSMTDAKQQKLVWTYDSIGRKKVQYLGSTAGTKMLSWEYDPAGGKGQLASSSRWVGTDEYKTKVRGYTPLYQPTGEDITIPASVTGLAGTYSTTRGYKVDGSLATVSYPNVGGLGAETLTYTYDDATGQPEQLQTNAPGLGQYVTNTDYTAYGETSFIQFQATSGNWLQRGFTYDDVTRRLVRAQTIRQLSPQTVADVNLTYDATGNVVKLADAPSGAAADTQCFTYDFEQRLSEAWTPTTGDCSAAASASGLGGPAPYWQSWTFDAAGNRKTQTAHAAAGDTIASYTYPAATAAHAHGVTAVTVTGPGGNSATSYGYDEAGNMNSRPAAAGGTQTLNWDVEGHLTSVTDGSGTTGNVYSAEGTRLLRADASGTTLYLPGQEVRRNKSTGVVTATRFYNWAGQDCASVTSGGPLTWLVTDTQGTQQLSIAAGNQAIVQRRQTPYGGARGTAVAWGSERGFVGGDNDPTGLVHIGARYYDSALGRFISVDPVFDSNKPASWNAYSYADNSPITLSDPTGMDSCLVCNIPGFVPAWKAGVYAFGKTAGAMTSGVDHGGKAADNGLAYMSSNYGGAWTDLYHRERSITTAVMGSPSDPSPVRCGWEWVSGTGPDDRTLTEDNSMTKQLQKHSHVQKAREMVAEQIAKNNPEYTPEYAADKSNATKTLSYTLNTKHLIDDIRHNETAFFLGSYDLKWEVDSIDRNAGVATVTFWVENESDMNSGTHTAPFLGGYSQEWDEKVGNWVNSKFQRGPGSAKKQRIQWKEKISFRKSKPSSGGSSSEGASSGGTDFNSSIPQSVLIQKGT